MINEEYLSDRTAIPNIEDEKYQTVDIVCTVKATVEVPDGFELRSDAKEWIESNYNLYNNKSNKYIFDNADEVYIEEIEYQTREW